MEVLTGGRVVGSLLRGSEALLIAMQKADGIIRKAVAMF